MIKIIPTQDEDIIINHKKRPVPLDKLVLDGWVLPQLAELAHRITDSDGHKISAISYEDGKIMFSRIVDTHEIPIYIEHFHLQQLRSCLKELELAIVEQWDNLFSIPGKRRE